METTRNTSSWISCKRRWQTGKRVFLTPSGIVLFIVILFGILSGQQSFAQGVGISETSISPDPSSILELKWTSGTFKGFLAPRMTFANMLAIPSPAQGLLVYATDTKSFWYYDSGWKAVMGSATLGGSNQLLGMNAAGSENEYKTLYGSNNILVTHGVGSITLNTVQDIHSGATPTFTGLTLSGLTPDAGVYTNSASGLTSTPPTTGILGYWSRTVNVLTPTTPGDAVTTSGNISTTGSGTITSAGLLTGQAGATISGATTISGGAINLNDNSNNPTNINTGSSTGAVTIGGSSITLPAFTTAGLVHNSATGVLSTGLLSNADIADGTIDLTSKVTGILPVPNGGTGVNTLNNHGVVIGQGTSAVAVTATGTAGQVLQSRGSGADPGYTTAIYPGTTTINQLLYSSADNNITGLSTANDGVLITSGTGIPSISSTLPALVQDNITRVGTVTSGTWNGTILGLAYGGTNTNLASGAAVGDLLYGTATGFARLADVATGNVLISGGTGTAPLWGKVDLSQHLTGVLPIANGGTNSGGPLTGSSIMISDGTSIIQGEKGTTTTVLHGNANGAPGYGPVVNADIADGTIDLLSKVVNVLPVANGGTGFGATYTGGQLLIGNSSGTLTQATLTGTTNQINVTNGSGSITLSAPQDIHTGATPTFTGLTLSGLTPDAGVYTNSANGLTSTPPTTGILGYWSRTGSVLTPTTAGDAVTTSGNISTTGSGTITSAGLLTGQAGATISGATTISGGAINLNDNSGNPTNINTGSSAGAVTIGGSSNTITMPGFTTAGVVHNAAGGLLSSGLVTGSDIADGTIDLTNKVTGILPIANGGTNWAGPLSNNRIMLSSGGSIVEAGAMNNGQVITGSTGSAPQIVTLGGDATIANTGILTLANTGVTAGSYGDATHVGNFIVDIKGRLTYAGTTLITGTTPGGPAGGDLSGTYPDPTVSRINGSLLGVTTVTDGHLLVANGTSWNSVATSGDVTIDNTGLTTISSGAVTTGKIADGTILNVDIADGTIDLTSKVTGILPLANGGTNTDLSGGTVGDLLYGTTTGFARLADVATGNVLLSGGTATAPQWGKVDLSQHLTGVLPIANGGTNSGTALDGSSIMISNGTAVVQGEKGTTTTVLHGNTSGAPAYGLVVNDDIADGTINLTNKVTGILPIANGGTNSGAALNNGRVMVSRGDKIVEAGLMNNGQILVGSTGVEPVIVTMDGDLTIDNTGATLIGTGVVTTGKISDGTIVNADIDAAAAIEATKLAAGTVDNTEFGYLNNVSAPIQTQFNNQQTELDATQAGAGLGANGAYTANGSTNYIKTASSLKDADEKIDAQVKLNTDNIAASATDITDLQTEVNTIETGSGLETDGSYLANSSTTYLQGATSLKVADNLLDAQLKTTTDNLAGEITRATGAESTLTTNLSNEVTRATAAEGVLTTNLTAEVTRATAAEGILATDLTTETTNRTTADATITTNLTAETTARTNADASIQTELDATQAGAGLAANGGYTANGSTNYIKTASSLKDADEKIDAQVKLNTDNIAASATDITGLQTEVNTIETGSGLETDGSYMANSSTTYLQGATSLKVADNLLDAQLKTTTDNLASEVTRATGAESTLTTNLSNEVTRATAVEGVLTTNLTAEVTRATAAEGILATDLTTETTNRTTADATITTNLTAETTARTNADASIQTELDATQAGAGLAANGGYTANGSTNYIKTASSLKDADEKLDAQVKLNTDNIAASATDITGLQTEVNTIETGSGLETDGSYLANSSTTYLQGATSLKVADNLLDAQLKTTTDNLANEITRATGAESTLTTNLSNEVTRATAAEGVLTTNLAAEVTRATAAEGILATDLTTETTNRTTADATITTNLTAETTARTNADASIQTELDATQAGAGLAANGGYTANGSTNYIKTASSLKDADEKLDAQVKLNTDNIAASATDITDLQTEVNTIETGSGLETDGSYLANSSTTYLQGATSLKVADNLLDAQLKTTTDNLAGEITRATGAESTLTTNLSNEVTRATAAEGVLTTNLTAEVTRATAAEGTLTTNLATETTNRTNADATLQGEIDAKQTATLTNGNILVGNASNVATSVTMGGDATIINTGALTVNRIKGVPLGSTTATNNNILVANGTQWNSVSTSGDVTIDNTGATLIGTGAVTTVKISDGTIVNADIDAAAGIEDTKLGTISTAGKVANSATTATTSNTPSTIVLRDANGDFSTGKITATEFIGPLTGNVTGSLTGNVTGNVSGTSLNVTGIVAILNGGTGSSTVVGAKTNLGLENVDNTSDANKPISTATQTALDSKAPLASPTLTGTPSAPTAAPGTNTTQIATTAFVSDAVTTATPDATTIIKGKVKLAGDLSGTADLPTISAGAIDNGKISATASIADTKLATISTVGKVANSATTATASNTANTIVLRDASQNFSAGTITAALNGNAATATLASTVTTNANLTGPITSVGNATSVASQTGTGSKFVMDTSPVLITPTLGVAKATTINGNTITTGTGTLTIAAGKTLEATDNATVSGTNTGDNAVNTLYSGLVTNATHTGDVTGSDALTITNNTVTNAKLATVATATIKGRVTAGPGNVEDLTAAQVRTLLNVADGANNYTHPTGDGNLHVIATSTTNSGKVLTAGATAGSLLWTTPTNGTVTTVSVVSGNGLSGTVVNAGTTPAITLSTSVSGILKGNGTAISAATVGTDYAPATSGSSILKGNGSGGFSSAVAKTDYVPATTGNALQKADGSGGLTAATAIDIPNIAESQVINLTTDLSNRALTSTTVNGYALSSNVTISASDITTGTLPHAQLPTLLSGDIPDNAANTTGTAANVTGTVTVANGGTGLTGFGGTNTLLYTTTANNLSYIPTANNGILVTSPGGVPSIGNTVGAALTMPSINLSASSDQLILQSTGIKGTLTWSPTGSDKTITFPDASGTVALVGVGSYWSLGGNAGTNPSNNFIGTLDDNDIVFRANNIERGRLESGTGDFKFGDANSGTVKATKELILRQDGDVYGPSILRLRNRNDENGAIFETTDPSITLIDFIFKTSDGGSGTVQRNIRFEARPTYARTGYPSFEIGGSDPDYSTLSIGDTYAAFAKPLYIGILNTSPSVPYPNPTALLQLAAGTSSANTAPLKFTSGTSMSTPEAGAVEYDGTNFYGTASDFTRRTFAMLTNGVLPVSNLPAGTMVLLYADENETSGTSSSNNVVSFNVLPNTYSKIMVEADITLTQNGATDANWSFEAFYDGTSKKAIPLRAKGNNANDSHRIGAVLKYSEAFTSGGPISIDVTASSAAGTWYIRGFRIYGVI